MRSQLQSSSWTVVELQILKALTSQVKVLTELQIQAVWNHVASQRSLCESTVRFISAGLITSQVWSVVVPVISQQPEFTWRPGDTVPDAWRLSQRLRGRWDRKPQIVRIFQATELAGRLFGSRCGSPIREFERRHDLLLTEVFVLYHRRLPQLAKFWVGECALPMAERGVKNPDAFLIDADKQVRRVIESAGSYSQSQVESFHRYCQHARLPYELW